MTISLFYNMYLVDNNKAVFYIYVLSYFCYLVNFIFFSHIIYILTLLKLNYNYTIELNIYNIIINRTPEFIFYTYIMHEKLDKYTMKKLINLGFKNVFIFK